MKRVLIVSPNWPPISYPDMHRVRMALPFFKDHGWEPLILTIDPNQQQGLKDWELSQTVPPETRVWQAGFVPKTLTSWFGLRSVGLRSAAHIAALGRSIIKQEK